MEDKKTNLSDISKEKKEKGKLTKTNKNTSIVLSVIFALNSLATFYFSMPFINSTIAGTMKIVYQNEFNQYNTLIKKLVELFKELKIDTPAKVFGAISCLIEEGNLSESGNISYEANYNDAIPTYEGEGMSIASGKSLCFNLSELLNRVFREMNYNSYILTNEIDEEEIKYSPVISNHCYVILFINKQMWIYDLMWGTIFKNKGNLNIECLIYGKTNGEIYSKINLFNNHITALNFFDTINITEGMLKAEIPTGIDCYMQTKEYLEGINICKENDERILEFRDEIYPILQYLSNTFSNKKVK